MESLISTTDSKDRKGAFALAKAPRADQPEFPRVFVFGDIEAEDDPGLKDAPRPLHGSPTASAASTRLKAQEALRQMQADREDAEEKRKAKKAVDDEIADELAHLAAWNLEITCVAGVEMTNAEAQEARKSVIDNADTYAKWAIRKGYLKPGQEDEFRRTAERVRELEDRAGRGIITDAERAERETLRQSEAGKAIDRATAHCHQSRGFRPDVSAASSADLARSTTAMAVSEADLFQDTQKAAPGLSAAPLRALPSDAFARPKVESRVAATGLDL